MSLIEIKEKLQQSYDTENWNVIEELISELEIQLELDYIPGQYDEVRDEDWN
jgi:hypothetical protein